MHGRSSKSAGPQSDGGTTSEPFRRPETGESISSAAGSLAKISVSPESKPESTGRSPVSGPTSHGLSVFYDPGTSSWKTLRLWSNGDSAALSATLPRSGILRSGMLSQRSPLAPRTSGKGSGLLPTPSASAANQGPNEWDGKRGQTLIGAVLGQPWPTPSASNPNDGEDLENWAARREREKVKGRNGNGFGMPLGIAVQIVYPSPTCCHRDLAGGSNSRDSAKKRGIYIGGALNPQFVEWLMGFPLGHTDCEPLETPSSQPSPNGSADSSCITTSINEGSYRMVKTEHVNGHRNGTVSAMPPADLDQLRTDAAVAAGRLLSGLHGEQARLRAQLERIEREIGLTERAAMGELAALAIDPPNGQHRNGWGFPSAAEVGARADRPFEMAGPADPTAPLRELADGIADCTETPEEVAAELGHGGWQAGGDGPVGQPGPQSVTVLKDEAAIDPPDTLLFHALGGLDKAVRKDFLREAEANGIDTLGDLANAIADDTTLEDLCSLPSLARAVRTSLRAWSLKAGWADHRIGADGLPREWFEEEPEPAKPEPKPLKKAAAKKPAAEKPYGFDMIAVMNDGTEKRLHYVCKTAEQAGRLAHRSFGGIKEFQNVEPLTREAYQRTYGTRTGRD
jgi:hypothetical protein